MDKAIGFVFDAIRFPVIQQKHTAQVSRPLEIPVFAIEEGIVNAVAHNLYTETVLSSMGLNERQMKAVQLIKEKGSISLADFKAVYSGGAERTLSRDLQILVDKGILKPKGEKKGRRYGL